VNRYHTAGAVGLSSVLSNAFQINRTLPRVGK